MNTSNISAMVVLKACDDFITNEWGDILAERERLITRAMLPSKLLGVTIQQFTREEAIKHLEGTISWRLTNYRDKKISDLKILCEKTINHNSCSTITLDSKTARILQDYL